MFHRECGDAWTQSRIQARIIHDTIYRKGARNDLERYIDGINAEPVVFKWTYGINDAIRV